MLKWVGWAMAFLMGAPAFVWTSGALLPAEHRVGASARFKAAPEAVWAAITDVENYPRWRSEIVKVEVVALDPKITWKEIGSDGSGMVFQEGESHYPDKWSCKTLERDSVQPRGGLWTFHLIASQDGGTRLVIDETGVLRKPLDRFRARFVTGYSEGINRYLDALKVRLAE